MKRIGLFLLFTFTLTWLFALAGYIFNFSTASIYTAPFMWIPALGVWLTKKTTNGEKILVPSMKPLIRRNAQWYIIAWIFPVLFVTLGALLYFFIFKEQFNRAESILSAELLAAIVLSPFINVFFALGEEVGWRGFLFPALTKHMSKAKAYFLVGIIWGVWHIPINLGIVYGKEYAGYPWLGILIFCVFTFAVSVFLSWLTEKTNAIWPAALAHGSINAMGGLPTLLLSSTTTHNSLLGPSLNGLISLIPLFIFALSIVFMMKKNKNPGS